MTSHLFLYRRAVKQAILDAAPADPQLAALLAAWRPYVAAWDVAHQPPRGLASLWAALCGASTQRRAAQRYLAGVQPCTRDSRLAPPGWTVEPRKSRNGGRPKGAKNRAKAANPAAPKLSPDI